jgi:hypothetical protein
VFYNLLHLFILSLFLIVIHFTNNDFIENTRYISITIILYYIFYSKISNRIFFKHTNAFKNNSQKIYLTKLHGLVTMGLFLVLIALIEVYLLLPILIIGVFTKKHIQNYLEQNYLDDINYFKSYK